MTNTIIPHSLAFTKLDVLTDGQTVFNYDFLATATADLKAIYETPDKTATVVMSGGADFNVVVGLDNPQGGTVQIINGMALLAGGSFTIYREIVIERENDYQRDLHADDVNREQGEIYQILQQLQRDIGSTLKVLPGQPVPSIAGLIAMAAKIDLTYDQFLSSYYGALAEDPEVDPLGNPPAEGALYFNTSSGTLRVYHSGAWQSQDFSLPDGSVTTPKLADGSVDDSKLSDALKSKIGLTYLDRADLAASTVADGVDFVRLTYRSAAVQQKGGGLYKRVSAEEAARWPSLSVAQDASGAWFLLQAEGGKVTPEQLGGFPLISCDPATKAWYDACSVKPTYLHLMHMDRTISFLKWRGLWSKITQFLSVGGEAKADAGINVKSPGTKNATIVGGGTFTPGLGFTADGTTGYIDVGPWNGLIKQNASFILLAFEPAFGTVGPAVSSVSGSAAGISMIPSTGTVATVRLNSTTVSTPRDHRSGNFMVSRDNSANLIVWEDGEVLARITAASTAVTTENGSIFRAGGGYVPETARAFVTGDVALGNNHQDGADLNLIINWHVEGLAGVVGKGPACESIGFTSPVTNTQRTEAINQAYDFAAMSGCKVEYGMGCYVINATIAAARTNVESYGASRLGANIVCGDDFPANAPMMAPSHFNGGERGWAIHDLTLNMRTTARGIVNTGTVRPGPSGINTSGSTLARVFAIDILDPNLHGIDDCCTGALNGSGVRSYDPSPTPTKWISGVPARDNMFEDIRAFNVGDDGWTAHYSNGRNGYVRNVATWWTSGRNGLEASMSAEVDDGGEEYNIDGVYGFGLHSVSSLKNHVPCPSPRRCTLNNVTAERCGRIVYLGDGNMIGGNHHSLKGLRLSRPWTPAYATESARPITIWGVTDIDISDVSVTARGDAEEGAPLYSVIQMANGVKRLRVAKGSFLNWKARSDLTTPSGATIRTDATSEDLSLSDINITGAGVYGVYDTGSARPDYDRITISGTGTAASYPVRISNKVSHTTRAIKAVGAYSAGVSGFQNASDI